MLEENEIEDGFVDISDEKDGSLLKKVLKEGNGEESPPKGSDVWFHYVGTLHADGTQFDASRDHGQEFKFQVGSPGVMKAWDLGIRTMKKGEICIVRAASKHAYGERGSPPEIPGGATVDFEFELFRWQERQPEPHTMDSDEERSAYALSQKAAGNASVQAQDWATALEKYASGLYFVKFNMGRSPDAAAAVAAADSGYDAMNLSDEDRKLFVTLLSNSAMVHLKLKEPKAAAVECTEALTIDATNIKILYRRAQACTELGAWALAIEDTDRILELEPTHADAYKMKQTAIVKEKAAKKKEKEIYGKMFG